MIITKTPFRMSFFGGGTDMESYFKEHGGIVLSTTIDKYCYVIVRHLPKFFEYKTHLTYSRMEYVSQYSEIEHPAIRETMRMLDIHDIHLTYDADLPARSGLGTSSSFVVGMLNAFYALKGKYADKEKIAKDAIYIERVLCNEAGGWQDQIAAAYGGFNKIVFENDSFKVCPLIIKPERMKILESNLMMFFTGFVRNSSDIINSTVSPKDKKKQLDEMKALAFEAEKVLTDSSRDIDDFGRLLDKSWQLKKQTGKNISNSDLDALYERGIKAGALGGKVLGAGGGGFLVFYVQPQQQQALRKAMKDLLYVPFGFENTGTQIVHYTAETYEPRNDE